MNYNFNDVENFLIQFLNKDVNDVKQFICFVLDISLTEFACKKSYSNQEFNKLKNIAKKIKQGYPLNKAVGYAFFYGRKYKINKFVLAPRQETELVCERALLELDNQKEKKVLDLCCGCGVIGITIAKQNEKAVVSCSDISKKALDVASFNAKEHNANIKFIHSDMLKNISGKFNLIVSNPPYVSQKDYANLDSCVKNFDPKLSLVANSNGLSFYKKIASSVADYLEKDGVIVLEIGYNQGEDVQKIFSKQFKDVKVYNDYNNNNRIVVVKGAKLYDR